MKTYNIKATNQKGESTIGNVELSAEQAEQLRSRFNEQLPKCKFEVIPTN